MKRFRSKPLDVAVDREDVTRADLVFYEVDHSGASYEARIFLDNPRADAATERDVEKGYAGSFTVFGHGGCYGEEGHCAPNDRTADEFDHRLAHPLTPQTRTVTVTDALRRTTGKQVGVTIVAVAPEEAAAELPSAICTEVRLLAYQD